MLKVVRGDSTCDDEMVQQLLNSPTHIPRRWKRFIGIDSNHVILRYNADRSTQQQQRDVVLVRTQAVVGMTNLSLHTNFLAVVRFQVGPADGHVVSAAAVQTVRRRDHHVGRYERSAAEEVLASVGECDGVGITIRVGVGSSDDSIRRFLLYEQIGGGGGSEQDAADDEGA